ncbi:MAG TPA: transcriptional repressor [Chloroflexia bacterium]|nr:transcriptional repressor [Chloroflexia bacterium]
MRLSINKTLDSDVAGALVKRVAGSGLRMTEPRRAVLGQIALQRSSFTAAELLYAVERCAPNVGRATVFRTLELLVEQGILRRVHTESGANWGHSYVLCGLSDAHHHHLVCTVCGRVSDFEGCSVDGLIEGLKGQTGFRVQGHHLELYGECEECQGR